MKTSAGLHKFKLFDGAPLANSAYAGGPILLYPFRSVSVQEFSFPFSGISRVREALGIRFRPLLGEASERVSIVPFLVNSERRSSSGCVFLLFRDEIEGLESCIGGGDTWQAWPDALVFAGEIGGSGLIVWTDDDAITTVWLEDWSPKLYKTVLAEDSSEEEEERLAVEYISGLGKSVENVFPVRRSDITDSDIQAYGTRTLAGCPAYEQLDLSKRGANLLEKRERAVGALLGASRLIAGLGVAALLLSGGVYAFNLSLDAAAQAKMETIYEASFGERSSQPLRSITEKLRSLSGGPSETSLYDTLRSVSSVWDKMGVSSDVYIETLRYGADNTDIMGTAKNNEAIQTLRQRIEEEGLSARTDNVQTIPGGELRFNLNISRGSQ
ncbi:MAG: hypothetical protein LBQ56_04310 [Synergistaceae bacterium]|jgi:hypothetical protein|nr:hypothetical protein [Synergistaceae bacterium]